MEAGNIYSFKPDQAYSKYFPSGEIISVIDSVDGHLMYVLLEIKPAHDAGFFRKRTLPVTLRPCGSGYFGDPAGQHYELNDQQYLNACSLIEAYRVAPSKGQGLEWLIRDKPIIFSKGQQQAL